MCAVGNSNRELVEPVRISTRTPAETMAEVCEYFEKQLQQYSLQSFGICSFGPLDLRPASATYRQMINTPKPGWSGANVAQTLEDKFKIPAVIDTDVNGAALSEHLWGAGQDVDSMIYLTIGTGIGGGAVVDGKLVHGLMHPEMGHLLVRHHPDDPYAGHCPYHKDCFEGLANGPAMQARWGKPAYELPNDHPAWELEADYIAQALMAYTYILSPQRIILGGGVMQNPALFPMIRTRLHDKLAGYLAPQDLEHYITSPGLDQSSGLLGAIALALSH